MNNSVVSIPNPVVNGVREKDADYVFYELTRSICPKCRRVIDAKILLRNNKVFMAKRCPDCGPFEALVYGDAEAYRSAATRAWKRRLAFRRGGFSLARDRANTRLAYRDCWFQTLACPAGASYPALRVPS